jgi:hypothetical protein
LAKKPSALFLIASTSTLIRTKQYAVGIAGIRQILVRLPTLSEWLKAGVSHASGIVKEPLTTDSPGKNGTSMNYERLTGSMGVLAKDNPVPVRAVDRSDLKFTGWCTFDPNGCLDRLNGGEKVGAFKFEYFSIRIVPSQFLI